MTDIVERLRQKERDYYSRDTGGAFGMGPVLRDAADEIERLRGLLGEAADDIEHWGGYASEYFKDKWHLEDDIKKYRDAALAGAAVQPSVAPHGGPPMSLRECMEAEERTPDAPTFSYPTWTCVHCKWVNTLDSDCFACKRPRDTEAK